MLRLAALALFVSSLVPTRADVTFAAGALAKDARLAVESTSEMKAKIDVKMGGQTVNSQDLNQQQHVVCTVESTAADDVGATAAKLLFGECKETIPSPFGAAQSKEAAFSKGTFTVKRGATGFALAEPASAAKEVAEQVGYVSSSSLAAPLASVLVGKTLKVGDKVELPADVALKAFACFAQDAKVKSATLELTGEKKEGELDCATFKATLVMATGMGGGAGGAGGEGGLGDLAIESKGDVSVTKSGARLVAADLPGTVSMKASIDPGNGQKIDMVASGTVTWKFSVQPAAANAK
jgi:hypothetical protein